MSLECGEKSGVKKGELANSVLSVRIKYQGKLHFKYIGSDTVRVEDCHTEAYAHRVSSCFAFRVDQGVQAGDWHTRSHCCGSEGGSKWIDSRNILE